MNGLLGERLLKADAEAPTTSLRGAIVGLYFSAHWCGPCQAYTPELRKAYERARRKGRSLEIVFVSWDRDQTSFREYFGTMPWHAVPFEDRTRAQVLNQVFSVSGIPSLVLLNSAGGIIDRNARAKAVDPSWPLTLPREIELEEAELPSGPVSLKLRHKGQEMEVECDPDEGWDVLKMQIFSLTEVPPEQQRLFGLGISHGQVSEQASLAKALALALRGPGGVPANVPEDKRCASSTHDTVENCGTLGARQAWASAVNNLEQWYQMDVGEVKEIAGVLLKGRADQPQWVTRFKASCAAAADGPWVMVDGGREFRGVRSWPCGSVRAAFAAPVAARFLRILPVAWSGHISLRADVLLPLPPGEADVPTVVVVGNQSAADVFEVAPPRVTAEDRTVEEQHLALLQAKMSASPQKLQHQVNSLQGVLKYEDLDLQRQALDEIPVVALDEVAVSAEAEADEGYEIAFMRQLLRWYKHDFFSWTNAPRCSFCGGETSCTGRGEPNPVERQFDAGVVEVCTCKVCGQITRFPRYNHPGKLLESRTGRCGEWANCFTLICRALGYEARSVHDWTDHVWTEVYSDSKKRWIHLDSCEAALDQPLIYESGWGKKLTYCIAFGRDNALDVTRRYSRKFSEVLTRRREFTEQQLVQAMRAIDEFALERSCSKLPDDVAERRRAALGARRRGEDEELQKTQPEASEAEQVGRTSGDAAWRDQRGELGSGEARKRALEKSDEGLFAPPPRPCSSPAVAAAPAASKFVPGKYRVVQEFALVRSNVSGGYDTLRKLERNAVVEVVEVHHVKDESCIRGKLAEGGWISLLNPETQYMWAQPETQSDNVGASVHQILVRAGDLIDQISFVYSDGTEKSWGESGGSLKEVFMIQSGEYLVKISWRAGDSLDSVKFVTSSGRESPTYGNVNGGSDRPAFVAAAGNQITGITRECGSCGKISGITEAKAPEEAVPRIDISCTWKDQGFGNTKGRIRILHVRRGAQLAERVLFGGLAGHDWQHPSDTIDSGPILENLCMGDELRFEYVVGGGGGHELHISNFRASLVTDGNPPVECSVDSRKDSTPTDAYRELTSITVPKLASQQEPASVSAAASAAAAPSEAGGGKSTQEVVKELFVKYVADGMPPNEAAVKAMADAKAQSSRPASRAE